MLSRSIRLLSSSSRAFSTVKNVEAASAAFSDIVASRVSCRSYKNQDVSDEVLNRILSLTLSAPTARNWQPYKIVIVKDKASLEKMSAWMPKKNADVIKQVPGVAVFLADTEPALMVDDLKGLWKSQGMDESKVPSFITEFTKTCGKDGMTKQLAKCGLKQMSNKTWSMEYYTNREWSIKQSVFPMEMFVLACQANGLSSIVMEGFDGRHVRDLVGFSKRYFVTGLVPFGYAKESDVKPTQRYPPEKMVFDEKNGVPRKGIVPLKRDWLVC